jgi:hypothetical protein
MSRLNFAFHSLGHEVAGSYVTMTGEFAVYLAVCPSPNTAFLAVSNEGGREMQTI